MIGEKVVWNMLEVAPSKTYHMLQGIPAYDQRFLSVLKFHHPGLAPVEDETGAFHIDISGLAIYKERYLRTFGFYDERAAVQSASGLFHIFPDGKEVYSNRFAWCGNFQEKYSVVRDFDGTFFHINHLGQRAYTDSFSYVGDFHEGIATAQNSEGLYTHIDAKGNLIHGVWFYDLDVYHKGFARAKDERGWFHIDQAGQAVYQERYQVVEPFYNGIARVESKAGALLLVDEKGELIRQLRAPLEDPFHKASAELVSYWRFYTLQAAIELEVFDLLPETAEVLGEKLELSETSTNRLLCALQELNFIERGQKGEWGLSSIGVFLKKNHRPSLKGAATLWKGEHMDAWKEIVYSLKTGKSAFNKQHGKGWFDWLKEHKEEDRLYHDVLQTYAERDYIKISQIIDFTKHRSLLDVGGGKGALMIQLLKSYPHLQGILFDLPNVIEQVKIPKELQLRMKSEGGDFFNVWPPFGVESALLSRVLHDWSDQEAIHILKSLFSVLSNAPTSRIYIIENILSCSGGHGGLLDLNMLVMTGGKERTVEQFKELLKKGGFELEKALSLNEVASILVAKKLTSTESAC
ncbi:methyltransferase [Candidatus Neptunochlamydia vexilliferae]|nr:methyltransferase [Candidatus Neptunochlamydia vexilliferae]